MLNNLHNKDIFKMPTSEDPITLILCALSFERWKRRINLLIKINNSKTNKMFGEIMKL
jgi:hypothetical protein